MVARGLTKIVSCRCRTASAALYDAHILFQFSLFFFFTVHVNIQHKKQRHAHEGRARSTGSATARGSRYNNPLPPPRRSIDQSRRANRLLASVRERSARFARTLLAVRCKIKGVRRVGHRSLDFHAHATHARTHSRDFFANRSRRQTGDKLRLAH